MENNILFWHRRDFRLEDNHGLYKALNSDGKVVPIFIFDTTILTRLKPEDQRILFIHQEIERLKKEYQNAGSDLNVYVGNPVELIPQICVEFNIQKVVVNRDYEPYALQRDTAIFELLKDNNIDFVGAKDHVVFEKQEVVKDDGKPYTVFTPYSRKWKARLTDADLAAFPSEKQLNNLKIFNEKQPLISIQELGFTGVKTVDFPEKLVNETLVTKYSEQRDFPAITGTSR